MTIKINNLDTLTPKQNITFQEFLLDRPKITVLTGAVRAGKTYLGTLLFLLMVKANEGKGHKYILAGATQSSIELNVVSMIEELTGMTIRKDRLNSFYLFGNRIICFDGDKANSFKKVRGFTAAGAYLNETTTLHDSFVKECIARCSVKDSRIIMDTNPDNPNHTIYKDYVLKDGQKLASGRTNIKVYNYTIFDNTFLDKEYIESFIKSLPNGVFKKRLVYGEWAKAEGLIYDMFNEEVHTYTESDFAKSFKDYDYYYVSVDYGTQNATSFLLWGSHKSKWYLVDEYYHSGRDTGVQKTDKEYCEDLIEFVGDREIQKVIVDPSAASFKLELRNAGFVLRNANNKVVDGIRFTQTLLHGNKIFINKRCKETIKEFSLYSWNDTKVNNGIDEPLKENDHSMDAMRYFCYTILRQFYKIEGLR